RIPSARTHHGVLIASLVRKASGRTHCGVFATGGVLSERCTAYCGVNIACCIVFERQLTNRRVCFGVRPTMKREITNCCLSQSGIARKRSYPVAGITARVSYGRQMNEYHRDNDWKG